jgi:hypothetical protein
MANENLDGLHHQAVRPLFVELQKDWLLGLDSARIPTPRLQLCEGIGYELPFLVAGNFEAVNQGGQIA